MKKQFIVTQVISVELDESQFSPKFLAEYQEHIGDLPTVGDHAAHLAEMLATGLIEGYPTEFVEGYGQLSEKGVKLKREGTEIEEVQPE